MASPVPLTIMFSSLDLIAVIVNLIARLQHMAVCIV